MNSQNTGGLNMMGPMGPFTMFGPMGPFGMFGHGGSMSQVPQQLPVFMNPQWNQLSPMNQQEAPPEIQGGKTTTSH